MSVDVAIIGGSQAGLALSYYLRQADIDHRVIEAGQVGDCWAERWDSLTLFSSAQFSALPGMEFPGVPSRYPTKDEVAQYLRTYQRTHDLPVREDTAVGAIAKTKKGFDLTLDSGDTLAARAVVLATGAFGEPAIPEIASGLARKMIHVHSSAYRNPAELEGQNILVVGGGNTGYQIAWELAEAGKSVELSVRTRMKELPQRFLGQDIFWWLNTFRVLEVKRGSRRAKRMGNKDIIIGRGRKKLIRKGITFRSEATEAHKRTVTFADGQASTPDAIVWATGFRYDDSWVQTPEALDDSGVLVTDDGHSPVEGLYTLGRVWQRDRGSSLTGFVGRDAFRLATDINHNLYYPEPALTQFAASLVQQNRCGNSHVQ